MLTIPFGVASGFAQFAMPFLLRRVGAPLAEISDYAALCLQPAAWQFLWAPIIDLGPRRKHWLLLMSAIGALCLFGALMMPLATHRAWFLRLTIAAQVFTGLVGSCVGGLMATTLPDERRGRAGGWSTAGNLGGAALGGGLVMWCAGHEMAPAMLGLITALLTFVPALGVFAIAEPVRTAHRVSEVFVCRPSAPRR
jgi:MFS family permease